MATLLLTAALTLMTGAWAQQDPSTEAAAQDVAAQEVAAQPAKPPVIEEVTATWWVSEQVQLQRWPDGGETVRTLSAGDEVELILREGEQVRVRKDLDFGWLPATALSDQPPGAEAAAL